MRVLRGRDDDQHPAGLQRQGQGRPRLGAVGVTCRTGSPASPARFRRGPDGDHDPPPPARGTVAHAVGRHAVRSFRRWSAAGGIPHRGAVQRQPTWPGTLGRTTPAPAAGAAVQRVCLRPPAGPQAWRDHGRLGRPPRRGGRQAVRRAGAGVAATAPRAGRRRPLPGRQRCAMKGCSLREPGRARTAGAKKYGWMHARLSAVSLIRDTRMVGLRADPRETVKQPEGSSPPCCEAVGQDGREPRALTPRPCRAVPPRPLWGPPGRRRPDQARHALRSGDHRPAVLAHHRRLLLRGVASRGTLAAGRSSTGVDWCGLQQLRPSTRVTAPNGSGKCAGASHIHSASTGPAARFQSAGRSRAGRRCAGTRSAR